MKRRALLAASAALAAPRMAAGQQQRVLKFIPQSDLAVVDPIWTTAYVTRNHGYLVFDTLYGTDDSFRVSPQMAEGHVTEDDGRRVVITLREGLRFHDNDPVRARDVVASLARWGRRDAFGQALFAATDELSELDDRRVQFRLKRPFPLLPDALGKAPSNMPAIMPERLAQTNAMAQVTEMVGSGPYRFVANERVPGSRIVYQRFEGYVPRPDGAPSFTAGPKVAHFDRIEWHVIPDAGTAAAALQAGEMDWWENPTSDLQALLRRNRNVVVEVQDPTGLIGIMRMNQLHPPFDNPAIRRALLGAVSQQDFMTAVIGTDPSLWREGVGVFAPGTPFASDAGLDPLRGPRDMEKVRRDLRAAGYTNQRVTLLAATDFPTLNALAQVGADMMRRAGMNVDLQSLDWGSVVQRRASREVPERGGWNVFFTFWAGLDHFNPAGHLSIRGNGLESWFGWPTAPRLEELRNAWFDARDLAAQQAIARDIQAQVMQDVPYIPLGQYFQATAYRRNLSNVLKGFVLFWNIQRS